MNVSPAFAMAHASAETGAADWGKLAFACVEQLGAMAQRATLGFIYVTDAFADDLASIVAFLKRTTSIREWVGTVGIGIVADREYFDHPAIAILAAALPADAHHLIPNFTDDVAALRDATDWAARVHPTLAVVHADPRTQNLVETVQALSRTTSTFLVGGLSSSRGTMDQVAGRVVRGGVSGVMLAPDLAVVTGLSQGCSPFGETHTITAGQQNVIFELDGKPALDVFKGDIGEVLARKLSSLGGYIHAAFPITGSDTGDYVVRNLVGIDPNRGWLAVGDHVAVGQQVLFVRRDRDAAVRDLTTMLSKLKRRLAGPARAGLYFSCLARGPNLFGPDSAELRIVRQELGEFPLVGMFCNGEISNDRLYGYTGVLTLFS